MGLCQARARSGTFLGPQAHCAPLDFSEGHCSQEGSKGLRIPQGGCSVVCLSVSQGSPMAGTLDLSFLVSVCLSRSL